LLQVLDSQLAGMVPSIVHEPDDFAIALYPTGLQVTCQVFCELGEGRAIGPFLCDRESY
jgi:hypothetical protein